METKKEQLESWLKTAESEVKKVGEYLLEEFKKFSQSNIEEKSPTSLVSYVDREAERMLQKACSSIIPEAGFIMEESGQENSDREYCWIIDPLDGTTNFMHGVPSFTISVALFHKPALPPESLAGLDKKHMGEVLLGMVYEPNLKEMFSALKGGGSQLNGTQIRASKAKNLEQSLMGVGFPYLDFDISSDYLSLFADFRTATRGVRRFGSAALDLAWVAAGRLDGFYEIGLNSWDVAAGILLVQEAGGKVSDFSGEEDALFGKQIAAGNARIHTAMLELIQKYYRR